MAGIVVDHLNLSVPQGCSMAFWDQMVQGIYHYEDAWFISTSEAFSCFWKTTDQENRITLVETDRKPDRSLHPDIRIHSTGKSLLQHPKGITHQRHWPGIEVVDLTSDANRKSRSVFSWHETASWYCNGIWLGKPKLLTGWTNQRFLIRQCELEMRSLDCFPCFERTGVTVDSPSHLLGERSSRWSHRSES